MNQMAIAFPFSDPMAIHIYGQFGIRWYGLAYTAGLLLGWYYMRRLCEDQRLWGGPAPMQPYQADDFLFWATVGTVLGGRTGYFLFYEPSTCSKSASILRDLARRHGIPWRAPGRGARGLAIRRRQHIPVRPLMDLSAAAVPFGLFFGRLANFVNAEIYGRLNGRVLGRGISSQGIAERAICLDRATPRKYMRRCSKAWSCSPFSASSRIAGVRWLRPG